MEGRISRVLSSVGKTGWVVLAGLTDLTDMAYRPGAYVFGNAHLKAARNLERRGWIELKKEEGRWATSLTKAGRIALDGGQSPETCWNAPWDGKWHLLLFDLPRSCRKERGRLHTWLRANRFGCLQGSLWISARPPPDGMIHHKKLDASTDRMMVVEADVKGGYRPADIVARAWDFKEINRSYEDFMDSLVQARKLARPLLIERAIKGWSIASYGDPLLPTAVLPRGYLGQKAWVQRNACLHAK